MSKLTRGQLKDLVKECLVEILSEGLSSPQAKLSHHTTRTASEERKSIPTRAQSPSVNSVSFSKMTSGVPQKNFESAVKKNVSLLTSDPVMSSIFADTASTTLQEQINADAVPGHSMPDDMISETSTQSGSGIDIFGDSAKNWAALAFSEAPKK